MNVPDDISKVLLQLYVTNLHVYKVDTKHCYALERDWQENSVTWNTPWQSPGGTFSEPPVFVNTNTQKNVWEDFDVTEAVYAMIQNQKPNYGFIISFPSTSDASRAAYYRSSEYSGDTSLRPKLTIVTGTTGTIDKNYKEGNQAKFKTIQSTLWIYIPKCNNAMISMYSIAGKKLAAIMVNGGSRWYPITDSFSPGAHIISIGNNEETIIKKIHFIK